jgi:hypothetical protein
MKVGHQRSTQTRGVWLWDNPVPVHHSDIPSTGATSNSSIDPSVPLSLLFFDTEGFESTGQSDAYDDRIFAFAAIISSTLVYNLAEAVRESDIEKLSFAVELATAFYPQYNAPLCAPFDLSVPCALVQCPSLACVRMGMGIAGRYTLKLCVTQDPEFGTHSPRAAGAVVQKCLEGNICVRSSGSLQARGDTIVVLHYTLTGWCRDEHCLDCRYKTTPFAGIVHSLMHIVSLTEHTLHCALRLMTALAPLVATVSIT